MHEIIQLPEQDCVGIYLDWIQLYRSGQSLTDISKMTGKAKNTIRDALLKAGIELRPRVALSTAEASREKRKSNIRPFYGFCYFQGQITPNPREFENLVLIHRMWSSGMNPNRIAETMNAKNIPARSSSQWSRNSIVNITIRFEKKQIILTKGGKYELR